MKAYQLIYTGCGKNKTGDFSVWSQSSEITKEESFEIVKMMSLVATMNTGLVFMMKIQNLMQ